MSHTFILTLQCSMVIITLFTTQLDPRILYFLEVLEMSKNQSSSFALQIIEQDYGLNWTKCDRKTKS